MRISVITPCFNCCRFLPATINSVLAQRAPLARLGVDLEYIIVDGASTDDTPNILSHYRPSIQHIISEPDNGPADAINKGLNLASGDFIAWLNADDFYTPNALPRFISCATRKPNRALYFGRCKIVNEDASAEIRKPITQFKNAFFPFSCQPLIQTINYISQPASFFSAAAVRKVGFLRTDLKAAFDYDYILRLWHHGGAAVIPGPPISNFRWYPGSISGNSFALQFKEEFEAARSDAGNFAPQTVLHFLVRHSIVTIYRTMQSHHNH